uniref:Uncharacterized protein n=1 Tax=Populus trichocarpa TaxID=3694 RepID=A9P8Y2_POPTR|nr:unknown [Populus trichocarpa]
MAFTNYNSRRWALLPCGCLSIKIIVPEYGCMFRIMYY